MIAPLKTIDPIIPVFTEYLNHMSQFFNIHHYDAWCAGAVKNLNGYSLAEDRHAYMVQESGVVIGFALVNGHLRFNGQGLAMAEFYIQKRHERKGYGQGLAEHIFTALPGHWEVAVTSANKSALNFWETVVDAYTLGQFRQEKKPGFIGFIFTNDSSP